MTIINLRDFYYWYTQDEYRGNLGTVGRLFATNDTLLSWMTVSLNSRQLP